MARPITIDAGGLPRDALQFLRMEGVEELGRPFAYELDLLGSDPALPLAGVVGKPLAVHMELPGSPMRHFHGVVTRVAQQGWMGRRVLYRATLQPALWLLTRRAGCRMFQNQAVPDIVRAVLGEYGLACDVKLSGSYPAREYVVQYRETDLAFVSRLMECEGIYFFFQHEAARETVVLADGVGAHARRSGYEKIPFFPPQQGERRKRDCVDQWLAFHQLEPTAFSLRDHDFTRPRASLEVKRADPGGGAPELEIYDYPGGYAANADGERYARTRLEEAAGRQARAEGAGDARGIAAGALFELTGHPRQDQNREYLVVSTACELRLPEQESEGAPEGAPVFRCRFTAQDSRTPFRPARSTPRPVVQGPQTARVVGKSGEEIWTDRYGRVKVEFPWDRASPGDEGSSCWVRVAQAWSGGSWGAMHVPRIGQEVVVEFLEGDPDRPLITGHLYEQDHMPPYPLPANQTRSGFKSRSTKGGGVDDANEIRFEDRKGDEQLYLQAQRNYDLLVKNDATRTIGHDERHHVENDETDEVGHDRRRSVGNDESVSIGKNRSKSVGADETVAVGGSRTESVDKDESVSISGNRSLQVTRDETTDVGGSRSESVGKDATLAVQGNRSESVAKDVSVSVSGARQTTVGKNDALQVDKALLVKAADEIVLESGSARLTLKKDGTIVLEGKDVNVTGSGKITVKASGDVVVKGSNVKVN